MTYAPRSLLDLGTLWSRFGGVMLGVVADQKHCSGYHLGKDRIYSDCACKPDGTCSPGKWSKDYSVTGARDKAGLTDAASAIDLGKLGGTYDNLYAFSMWLVRQCQEDALGARDVREIIYSPDGIKVQRYSGIDKEIHTGPGNGDLSHRFHTHISYFRDSERRDKTALFEPYFIPDTSTPEEPMPPIHLAPLTYTSKVVPKVGVPILREPRNEGPIIRKTVAGDKFNRVGMDGTFHVIEAQDPEIGPFTAYIARGNVNADEPIAAPLPDCSAAIEEDRAKARIVWP